MTHESPNLQWVEKSVRLTELRPFERNPRQITDIQFAKLKASLQQDGYHSRIKVTKDRRVIGGHQRIRALMELGYDEIMVLVPDRELSDDQFKAILLRDNHHNGTFDMDMLANDFDLEYLREEIGLHDVLGIAPEEEKPPTPGKKQVCCPKCSEVFPVKGNGVE